MDLSSTIIDMMCDAGFRLAWVAKQSDIKLQVQDQNGRSDRATPRLVLVTHGSCSAGDATHRMTELASRISVLAGTIDISLLWETVRDTAREYSVAELAAAYFPKPGAVEVSALGRVLAANGLRFRRNALLFTPRSVVEFEQLQQKQQREAERAARRERLARWLRFALDGGKPAPGEEADSAEFLGLTEAFLFHGQENDVSRLLTETAGKGNPRELALAVLRLAARLPADADPFLLVNGVTAQFSEAAMQAAAAARPFDGDSRRTDFAGVVTFSVDDPHTREIDDAISVALSDAGFTLGIHIADPAVFVHRDDPLDRAALERTLTLYLPTTAVHMLPARIGCDLASLKAGELRPAITFEITCDRAGTVTGSRITRSQIRVTQRLTYDDVDRVLADADCMEPAALVPAIRLAATLAGRLRAERFAHGAVQLARRDVDVHVHHGEITLSFLDGESPAHLLVSELMVLANRLAAEYALAHDIPFIYRAQDPPSQKVPVLTAYDPVCFERAVKCLRKTRLSTHPQPHAGLGLGVYTQVSSPIRRFADLALQRQLAAGLAGEPPPYSSLEIIEILGAADATEQRNRQLERDSTRWWLLEYLRRQPADAVYEAMVLSEPVWVELVPLTIRAKFAAPQRFETGATVNVRVAKADPDNALLLVEPVPA